MMDDVYDEGSIKPVFDGRLQYFKILGGYMDAMKEAMLHDDFEGWLRALQGCWIMVSPYIKDKSQVDEIKVLMDKAKTNISGVQGNIPSHLRVYNVNKLVGEVLLDASTLLHRYGSHVLLPSNMDEVDEDFETGIRREY